MAEIALKGHHQVITQTCLYEPFLFFQEHLIFQSSALIIHKLFEVLVLWLQTHRKVISWMLSVTVTVPRSLAWIPWPSNVSIVGTQYA
jgi:hypothetical protein